MPQVNQMRYDDPQDGYGFYLHGTDGTSITVTAQQILDQMSAETGTLEERKAKTKVWILGQMFMTFGLDQLSNDNFYIDFNPETGHATQVTIGNYWEE